MKDTCLVRVVAHAGVEDFAADLRRWRVRRGLSQSQAMAWLDAPRRSYQEWESGKGQPLDTAPIRNLMARRWPHIAGDRTLAAARLLRIGKVDVLSRLLSRLPPPGYSGEIDWSWVDWGLTTQQIARQTGKSIAHVSRARRRLDPGSVRTTIDWKSLSIDWTRSTGDLARELGIKPCNITMARRRFAPGLVKRRHRK